MRIVARTGAGALVVSLATVSLWSSGCLVFADAPNGAEEGSGGDGAGDAPETGWVQVAVNFSKVCALHGDGSLWCERSNDLERVSSTTYLALSSGFSPFDECAIDANGRLVCGVTADTGFELPGPFDAVSGGVGAGCARRPTGAARCWPEAENVSGPFTSLGAGDRFACGIDGAGALQCWSIDNLILDDALTTIPSGSFSEVRTSDGLGCARRADGVVCWGYDIYERTGTFAGSFVDLAINRRNACAVRASGELLCWGDGSSDPNKSHLFPPGDLRFTDVEVGNERGCGITDDSRLVCW